MATQLCGGVFNQLLGPRIVIGASLGLSAVATALVPLAAELASLWAVFFVRAALGALSVNLLIPQKLIYTLLKTSFFII